MNILRITACIAAGALTLAVARSEQKVTDAQIAAIVVVANQVDIDAGRLAVERSKNAEVKKFAETMVNDHTAVNKSAVELVTKLKVSPEENATSRALKTGGEENLAALRALRGRQFDRAYVEREVAYHEQVLEAIDNVLIPHASNAELKALLVKVRPAFVEHLNHAKHLHSSLR